MDPYVILICRSQEQKSSVASGKLSLFSSDFYMSTFHLDGTDTGHNFYPKKIPVVICLQNQMLCSCSFIIEKMG